MKIHQIEGMRAEYALSTYGQTVIRVYFQFTNQSSSSTSFYMTSYVEAYQNGIALYEVDPTEVTAEDQNYKASIQPGETIVCSMCFGLIDLETPIEIELQDIFDAERNLGTIYYQ